MRLPPRGHFPGRQSAYFKLVCPQCPYQVSLGIVAAGEDLLCVRCRVALVPDLKNQSISPDLDCGACGMRFTAYDADYCPMCRTPLWSLQ